MDQGETKEFIIRHAPRMAHRIYNDLSVVQAATDILITDGTIAPEVRDKIASVKARLQYIASSARQFLGESGNLESWRTVLNVRDYLSELAPLLERLLGERHQLQIALDPDLWPIIADTESIDTIIFNLLLNARDAMQADGSLRIRGTNITQAECEAHLNIAAIDYVLIELADTGIGIPEETVERIFDPFFTTRGPCRGFGLAAVSATIKNLNGHIIVKSAVGRGSTFTIFLPRSA